VGGDRGWKTFLQNAQLIEITNVMASNELAQSMPFQGVNKQYLQLLARLRGLPKYSEIRVRRANHGWGLQHHAEISKIAEDQELHRLQ